LECKDGPYGAIKLVPNCTREPLSCSRRRIPIFGRKLEKYMNSSRKPYTSSLALDEVNISRQRLYLEQFTLQSQKRGEESIYSSDMWGRCFTQAVFKGGKNISGTHSVECADYAVCGCDAV
jgi:hypothetical protein